jgi:putative oxidoreductase
MAGGKKLAGLNVGLLLLRLALGGIMMAHGIRKVYPDPGAGVQKFSDFVAKLGVGYPYAMACAAVAAEIVGGLLVIVGLFSRLGALSIAGVMFVAIFTVHWQNGFWIPHTAAPSGTVAVGYEYSLALLAMALCVVCAGPGSMKVPPR